MAATVKATLVDELLDHKAAPGAYKFYRTDTADPAGLNFVCPCGCGAILGVSFAPPGPVWTWDGDRECPTLSPSIRRIGGCGWHGYLRGGEWLTC